jgi:hypothetical protein
MSRVLAISTLLAGLLLVIFGAALVLNVLSLRDLAESSRLHPAIWAVFEVRDELSHRRAQWLELLLGLSGASMVVTAAWWLRAHRVGGAR